MASRHSSRQYGRAIDPDETNLAVDPSASQSYAAAARAGSGRIPAGRPSCPLRHHDPPSNSSQALVGRPRADPDEDGRHVRPASPEGTNEWREDAEVRDEDPQRRGSEHGDRADRHPRERHTTQPDEGDETDGDEPLALRPVEEAGDRPEAQERRQTVAATSGSTGGSANRARRTRPHRACGTAGCTSRRAMPTRAAGRARARRMARANQYGNRRSRRRTAGTATSSVTSTVRWTKTSMNQKCHRALRCDAGPDVVVDEQERAGAVPAGDEDPACCPQHRRRRRSKRRPHPGPDAVGGSRDGKQEAAEVVPGHGQHQVRAAGEEEHVHVRRDDGTDGDRPQRQRGVRCGRRSAWRRRRAEPVFTSERRGPTLTRARRRCAGASPTEGGRADVPIATSTRCS